MLRLEDGKIYCHWNIVSSGESRRKEVSISLDDFLTLVGESDSLETLRTKIFGFKSKSLKRTA